MYWNRGPSLTSPSVVTLNSNIRCIEIIIVKPAMTCVDSWIVTLDVLKFTYAHITFCFHNVE